MAPLFSAATRQLDADGNEHNACALSTVRVRDVAALNIEPGFARNGVFVVDNSQGNDETPDRYSYRTSFPRSNYPILTSNRRSEHQKVFRNDSIRRLDNSQIGRFQNGTPEWDGNEFALPPVLEQYPQSSSAKKSLLYKHTPSHINYHGAENCHDDLHHRSSVWHEVQPGVQHIHYDAKNDSKPKMGATMIEVSPGEFLRLRGADETWKAIHNDFYVPSACVMCDMTIFCIQDAVFVLCPECLVVSPIEGVVYDGYDGGVGMGFTIEIRSGVNRG